MKILLVEDDAEICSMLKTYLERENFEVAAACDGRQAVRMFSEERFDLVLLDLMIPKISGMDVLQKIRSQSVVPVIILSAKASETDKTLGLGADDYITKPFSLAEVLARVRAALRRTLQYDAEPVREPQVLKAGERIELTAKEFAILKLLMKNPKRVYTKEQIYSLVWNDEYFGDENAVNVHISRLRNKLEGDPRRPEYVVTVWGIGYKLGELS